MQIEKSGAEIRTIEDWYHHAPPKRGLCHWVAGRSALELARAWCGERPAPTVPIEVTELMKRHPDIVECKIQTATPEYQIRFDTFRGEPRNADLVAIAEDRFGLIGISIEAKADEPFDLLVRDVLKNAVEKIARDKKTNSVARVQNLAAALLPPAIGSSARLGDLRYQLLTGVAGALAYAREIGAKRAIFIVHEFITDRTDDDKHCANNADLNAFISRISRSEISQVQQGKLYGPFTVPGAPLFEEVPLLYIGKICRNLRRLET